MDVGFHFGRSFNFSFCLDYSRKKSVAGMYFSKSGKESEGNSAAVEDLITAFNATQKEVNIVLK